MNLTLQRQEATQHSTPGTLSYDDRVYQTLEPPPVPDPENLPLVGLETVPICIPAGIYKVTVKPSIRFQALVPVLLDVPGRSAIEMHYGSYVYDPAQQKFDTEGCILVGLWRENADEILGTREACINQLWPAIRNAIAAGEDVWIEVREWQSQT